MTNAWLGCTAPSSRSYLYPSSFDASSEMLNTDIHSVREPVPRKTYKYSSESASLNVVGAAALSESIDPFGPVSASVPLVPKRSKCKPM